MSDMSKADKLAAARRKLKEFQSQQKSKEINAPSNGKILELSNANNNEPCHDTFTSRSETLTSVSPNSNTGTSTINLNQLQVQQSALANYFPNPTDFVFDSTSNSISDQTNSNDSGNPSSFSSYFNSNTDDPFISFTSVSALSQRENGCGSQSDQTRNSEIDCLKQNLDASSSKILLQKEALDVLTAEKEDLQKKLQKAMDEIRNCQDNMRLLQEKMNESLKNETQLKTTVVELENFKATVTVRDLTMEQTLNDLREKNDELRHSLEIQKEKNTSLKRQFEETQSNYNMLALKFQQLGIDVGNDKSYHSVNEECEMWKRKCTELEENLRALTFEREHTNDEYRNYVHTIEQELAKKSDHLMELSSENQVMLEKITSQTNHIIQLEKQLQKPEIEGESDESTISRLCIENQNLKEERDEYVKLTKQLRAQLDDYELSIQRSMELEREMEHMRTEMMNAGELQEAIESNKVAASLAISQNNKLKVELEQLHQMVEKLNGEKNMLAQMLEEEKLRNIKTNYILSEQDKDGSHEITTNDAAINTDTNDGAGNGNGNSVYANVEAMLQLQEKFKSVLEKMADLTDEKQQLEHLVLQLQCETETIEEYVALYQKQRSVLQLRARETDLKMERVSQEKERLLNILRSILKTKQFDSDFIRKLVEEDLSLDLRNEVNKFDGFTYTNETLQQNPAQNDLSHHPTCPCCSGNLITV